MSPKQPYIRPEAGVVRWQQLTADQRDAARAIAKTLGGMVTEPSLPRRGHDWSFLPMIDPIRRNHVLLIDGKRGSGKSTVLVTLLDAWNHVARGEQVDAEDKELCPWSGPAVIPVGLLDLQPMDPSTNLLLHLIGTLQRVVDHLESQGTQREVKPGSWDMAPEIASRQAWRRFAKAAVAAGRGVPAPSRSTDLEEQVAEMEYRERERLDLTRAFVELVDTLHDDMLAWLRRGGLQAPDGMVFVVGIDDADMNPHKSVELLELLRTLWHRHLVYVLTGDSGLFLDLIERGLKRSGGKAIMRLGSEILDKIIPRRQRFRLNEVPLAARPNVLAGALRAQGISDDRASELLAHLRASPWLFPVIPSHLRPIADLAQALAERTDLRGQMRALFMDVIEELRDTMPTLGARCIVHDDGRALLVDLGLEQTTWRFLATRIQDVELSRDRPMRRARVHTHFITEASVSGTAPDVVPLGERYRAAALLGWRLAHERRDEYCFQSGQAEIAYEPVVTLIPRLGFAGADGEERLPPWQFPRWTDGWHHARAYACWNAMSMQLASDDASAMAWLAASYVASALAGEGMEVTSMEPTGELPWETLAQQVAELACGTGPGAVWAVTEAPLLAAPESGLSFEVANRWLSHLSNAFGSRNIEWRRRCERWRRTRLMSGQGGREDIAEQRTRVEIFLRSLDDHYMDYALRENLAREISAMLWNALRHVPVAFAGKLADRQGAPWHPVEPRNWQCIADLIEVDGERFTKLAALDWRRQHELAELVDSTSPPPKGMAQPLVYRMWQAANQSAPDRVDGLITLDHAKLRIHVTPPAANRESEALDVEMADGARLHLIHVSHPRFEELAPVESEHVYPAMDAVLRVALDLAADEADADGLAPDSPEGLDPSNHVALRGMPIWRPFALQTRHGSLHLPVPQWSALVDWETLIRAWNHTLQSIQKRQTQGLMFAPSHLDGFLAWYVKLISTIHHWRQSLPWEDVTPAAWDAPGLVHYIVSNIDHYNYMRANNANTAFRARDSAMHEWLKGIPAIFTPEFGLSNAVVQDALNRYAEGRYSRMPRVSDGQIPGRMLLQQARQRLWLLSGKPEAEIEDTLRRIDVDHPEHPWVKLMREAS
jgi:hypothetical protein